MGSTHAPLFVPICIYLFLTLYLILSNICYYGLFVSVRPEEANFPYIFLSLACLHSPKAVLGRPYIRQYMQMMHNTHKRCYRCHKDHHNHQLHRGQPPDRRQGAQKGPSAHAMPNGGPCSNVDSDSEEPLDGKAVQVHNPQTGHSGDMPPTTTNRKEHMPPPPPPCWHSHSQGIAHKRAMEPLPSVHATTQETRR